MNTDFTNAIFRDDVYTLSALIAADPSIVGSTDEMLFTGLHEAASSDRLLAAAVLLCKGADPNAKNYKGITPLYLVQSVSMTKLLIACGADVNSVADDGRNPFFAMTTSPDSFYIMEEMLKRGADFNVTNATGKTALDFAISRKEPQKVELIERYKAKAIT